MRDDHNDDLNSQMTANTVVIEPNADTMIVRADGARARRWRIGFQRLNRSDNFAPLIPGNVASGTPQSTLVSDAYSFSTGFQSIPTWPPVRTNPVNFSFDLTVQINWGFGGAQPAHIAAQWPRMGSSLVVVGSFVEVFAHWESNVPAPLPSSRPVCTAWVVPDDGELVRDAGELSLCQQVFLRNTGANGTDLGGVYVPDFARRVRVSATRPDPINASQQTTPLQGEINLIGAWVDDVGNVRNSWQQGVFTSNAAVEHNTPVEWQPVPAAATMLSLILPTNAANFAYVEWRIAP